MDISTANLEKTLDCALDAIAFFAECSLGDPGVEKIERTEPNRDDLGVAVPIVINGREVELSLLASRHDFESIVDAFLPPNCDKPQGYVDDAVSEIVNIVGGVVVRTLADRVDDVVLGLPRPYREATPAEDCADATVRIGESTTHLRVRSAP